MSSELATYLISATITPTKIVVAVVLVVVIVALIAFFMRRGRSA
jgi:preprotein translocase subunit Sec61beta